MSTIGHFAWRGAAGAALVAAVGLVFGDVVGFEFVNFDDDINIVLNPHLGELDSKAWRWVWTDMGYMRRYLPLSWIAWFGLFAAGGLEPWYYHTANLVVHAFNAVMVWIACAQALVVWCGRGSAQAPTLRTSVLPALAALLWAVHPLRVELVAWASGLLYLLSTAAALVAWVAFVQAQRHGWSNGWWLVSIVAYAASGLSYPVALGLPCLMLAWLCARQQAAHWRTLMLRLAPFLAISAATLGAALWARWSLAAGSEAVNEGMVPVWARLGRVAYIWVYYWWRPFWPGELSPVYDTFLGGAGRLAFAGAALLAVGVTMAAWRARQRMAWLFPVWLGYLAFMLPHSGLFEGAFFPADRYSYVIGVAQAIMSTLAIAWLGGRFGWAWVALPVALAGAWLGWRARVQTEIWRNTETLFTRIDEELEVPWVRASYRLRYAAVLAGYGQLAAARRVEEEAQALAPGVDFSWQLKLPRDYAELSAAAGLPGFAVQHQGLALARLRAGDRIGAHAHFQRALKLAPGYLEARYNFALAYAQWGEPREALAQFFALRETDVSPDQRRGFWSVLARSFRTQGMDGLAAAADARARAVN